MASTFLDRISGVETSIAIKAPVKVATTAPIALSGEQTIDGVAVVTGDRVLVKDQASAIDNGIWDVSTGVWARSDDFNGVRDATRGTSVLVTEGSKNGWTRFSLATDAPSIGVSGLTFFADGASFAVSPRNFGAVGNGVTDDTAAIRATFDRAISLLQSGYTTVEIDGLGQTFGLTDEALSDAFQSAWWSQTSLGKGKFLIAKNMSVTVLSGWVSGVRNVANGNQRSFGPWAGSASPSIIFPAIASKASAPASFSLRDVRMTGSDTPGKDPIPLLVMNELDARMTDLHVTNFSNWADVLMGSFNSTRMVTHFSGNGCQPVESGAVLGWAAGFPLPYVKFDYNATTNVVTAKALVAFSTYAIGDFLPFFNAAHVGKTFLLQSAALHGTTPQTLKATIASIGPVVGGGTATATLTVAAGVTDQNATGVAGSFMPVKATTTAGSAQITLSAPVKVGRGAADMVGQLIAIPKAGSTANTELDLFVSRVTACTTGDDTNGYTVLTLANAALNAVTEDFIWSAAHACIRDETTLAAGNAWRVNDTDFVQCLWELSGGYNADATTSAYQWISQDAGEAVQYVACKAHGADTARGAFGADGCAIIDSANGLSLIGMDFTHMVNGGKGSVRVMGSKSLVTMTACAIGSWQMPHDFKAIYIDPKAGYSAGEWSFVERDTLIKNDAFPVYSQAIYGKRSGLTEVDRVSLTSDRERRGAAAIELTSADDLDLLFIPGTYKWATPAPSNAPGFPDYSILEVAGGPDRVLQRLHDVDNFWTFERTRFAGAWSGWKILTLRSAPSGSFATASNNINTFGKAEGVTHRNTTDGKLYAATGSSATSTWVSADGATTITPA